MGKLVTVKTGFVAVLLPDSKGSGSYRNYVPGDQVTVTDAEYASFNQATLNSITLTTSGLPDPYRKASYAGAGQYQTAAFTAATGGVIAPGFTNITAPSGGVTYSNGWLQVAQNSPSASVVGPTPGSTVVFTVQHTQGATASTAPTGKSWFGGTYRTDNTVGLTNSSTTATNVNAQATDVGRVVTGTGIPAGTTVSSVSAGVSWTLSAAATATASNVSVAVSPLTRWPGGTVPTFTASAGAVDLFRFETYDGGSTYVNTLISKGLA